MPLEWLILPRRIRAPYRPGVRFSRVPAHRIPTLWSLYRPLIREAPTVEIFEAIKTYWRNYRHQLSLKVIIPWLREQYDVLEVFERGKGEDHKVVQRMVRHQGKKIWIKDWNAVYKRPQSDKELSPPTVTPALIYASEATPPMLRLKPMPVKLAMMHHHRHRRHQRREAKLDQARNWQSYGDLEGQFQTNLGLSGANWRSTLQPVVDHQLAGLDRDRARSQLPITPQLLDERYQALKRRSKYFETRAKKIRFEGKKRSLKETSQPEGSDVAKLLEQRQRRSEAMTKMWSEAENA